MFGTMNLSLGHLMELLLRGAQPIEMIILHVDLSTSIVHHGLLEVLIVEHLFVRKKAIADV